MAREEEGNNELLKIIRSKAMQQKIKDKQYLSVKLQDIEEVKKLALQEENFNEQHETAEDVAKTIKPQFVYDAALARQKEREKELRTKYEKIRNKFWKIWDPTKVLETHKVPAKVKNSLHPFNIEIMKATTPQEIAELNENSVMYKDCVRREAMDAIKLSANNKTPTSRMRNLQDILRELKTAAQITAAQPKYLFAETSQTSSVENVNEWIKHLKPFGSNVEVNAVGLIHAKPSTFLVKKARKPRFTITKANKKLMSQGSEIKSKKSKRRRLGSIVDEKITRERTSRKLSLKLEDTYSVISLTQLLWRVPSDTGVLEEPAPPPPPRRVDTLRKALELEEEVEMVRHLTDVSLETVESKSSKVDITPVADSTYWQDSQLYYQKQVGIDYDLNFNHPLIQQSRLPVVVPKQQVKKKISEK